MMNKLIAAIILILLFALNANADPNSVQCHQDSDCQVVCYNQAAAGGIIKTVCGCRSQAIPLKDDQWVPNNRPSIACQCDLQTQSCTINDKPTPSITSIFPSSGVAGAEVKIFGSGFTATNSVTIRNSTGGHAHIPGLISEDGKTLTFTIPAEMDLPYPILEGGVDVPPFRGDITPGFYEVLVDNGVGERMSNAVSFEVKEHK